MFKELANQRVSVLTSHEACVATEGFFSDAVKYMRRLGKEKKPSLGGSINLDAIRRTFANAEWLSAQSYPKPDTEVKAKCAHELLSVNGSLPTDIRGAFRQLETVLNSIVIPTVAATRDIAKIVSEAEKTAKIRDRSIPAEKRAEDFHKLIAGIKFPRPEETKRAIESLKGCLGGGTYEYGDGWFDAAAKPISSLKVIPEGKVKEHADVLIDVIARGGATLGKASSDVWKYAHDLADYSSDEDFYEEIIDYDLNETHHYEGNGHYGLQLVDACDYFHTQVAHALLVWIHESVR